jgi:hypothetical protein
MSYRMLGCFRVTKGTSVSTHMRCSPIVGNGSLLPKYEIRYDTLMMCVFRQNCVVGAYMTETKIFVPPTAVTINPFIPLSPRTRPGFDQLGVTRTACLRGTPFLTSQIHFRAPTLFSGLKLYLFNRSLSSMSILEMKSSP